MVRAVVVRDAVHPDRCHCLEYVHCVALPAVFFPNVDMCAGCSGILGNSWVHAPGTLGHTMYFAADAVCTTTQYLPQPSTPVPLEYLISSAVGTLVL